MLSPAGRASCRSVLVARKRCWAGARRSWMARFCPGSPGRDAPGLYSGSSPIWADASSQSPTRSTGPATTPPLTEKADSTTTFDPPNTLADRGYQRAHLVTPIKKTPGHTNLDKNAKKHNRFANTHRYVTAEIEAWRLRHAHRPAFTIIQKLIFLAQYDKSFA
uniref:Transposase n=1 Tax=Rathayibacter sp. FH 236 TaxID=2615183 RepID=A0A5J6SFZ0_9MICO|nr:transposase [Rathayibacter sp. FH 236]